MRERKVLTAKASIWTKLFPMLRQPKGCYSLSNSSFTTDWRASVNMYFKSWQRHMKKDFENTGWSEHSTVEKNHTIPTRHQVILWCKEISKNTLTNICPKYHIALSRSSAVYKLRSFRNQCTPFKTSVLLFTKQTHFLLPYSGTFPTKIRTSIYQIYLTYAINWLYVVQT